MKRSFLLGDNVLFAGSILAFMALVFDFGFRNNFWHQLLTDSFYLVYGLLFFGRMQRIILDNPAARRARRFSRYIILAAAGLLTLLALFNLLEFAFIKKGFIQPTAGLVLFLAVLDISARAYAIERQTLHPALAFVLSFFLLICIGAMLLQLPLATRQGISFIDALFTSTSAVCVTGLVVLDTGQDFTLFGQFILLMLIQLGALGMLTFTNLFGLFFQGYGSYRNRLMIKDMINARDIGDTFNTLIKIVTFTLLIESLGALLIYYNLDPGYAGREGRAFFAVFHAVSAFGNAGFSTLTNSLYEEGFRHDYSLHLVIAALIILGGVGYSVFINFYNYLKIILRYYYQRLYRRKEEAVYRKPNISVNTRIVLTATLTLLLGGALAFYVLEYDNTLAGHDGWGKIATAFFGSVTTRTAGFNTVDTASLTLPTLLLFFLLMWVGASPGSTGGGIKTTTFALSLMNIYRQILGQDRIIFGWKQIPAQALQRATAVILLSLLGIGASIFSVLYFDGHLGLMPIAFECISAYSTVGLSMGITASLSPASKLTLILAMFVGRVSFLTLLTGIARQFAPRRHNPIRYPEEDILIN
ncbi:MAG: ATPase [Lewinellaceae bacterium]|nr:ATPase [Lewinellaceae bacterium]